MAGCGECQMQLRLLSYSGPVYLLSSSIVAPSTPSLIVLTPTAFLQVYHDGPLAVIIVDDDLSNDPGVQVVLSTYRCVLLGTSQSNVRPRVHRGALREDGPFALVRAHA